MTEQQTINDEDLKKLILKAVGSCSIEGWQFYFCLGKNTNDPETPEEMEYILISISPKHDYSELLAFESTKPPSGVYPLDVNTLLVMSLNDSKPLCVLTTDDSWTSLSRIRTGTAGFFTKFIKSFQHSLPSHSSSSNLAKLRRNENTDFTISCKGGDLQVHSLVLSTLWPFFKGLLDTKMEEQENKKLNLNYPVIWIEAVISYLYEERKPLHFDQAVGLIEVAQVYDLPELLTKAMQRIKAEKMDLQQAMRAWMQAHVAENTAMREYCAKKIRGMLSVGKVPEELLVEFTKEQFVQLHLDFARNEVVTEPEQKAEQTETVNTV